MKAVFHLGLPKTGTTSIQHFLLANANALSARGVAYEQVPNATVEPQDSQLEFGICQFARAGEIVPFEPTVRGYGLTSLEAQEKFAKQFEATLLKHVSRRTEDVYVISSEHVGAWTRTPKHVAALDTWLSSIFDEVRYVQYIRRQEDWLMSRYSQDLRTGHPVHLFKYLERHGKHDFATKADLWSDVVGRDRFDLRLMERDAMVDGDLIADFASAVGFDASGLPMPPRENESLTPQAAFFLRKLNGRLRNREAGFDHDLQFKVERRLSSWSEGKTKLRMRPQQIDWIRKRNAEVNEAVRAKYFPDREELFPARPHVTGEDGLITNITQEQVAGIGVELLLQLLGEEKRSATASGKDAKLEPRKKQ